MLDVSDGGAHGLQPWVQSPDALLQKGAEGQGGDTIWGEPVVLELGPIRMGHAGVMLGGAAHHRKGLPRGGCTRPHKGGNK